MKGTGSDADYGLEDADDEDEIVYEVFYDSYKIKETLKNQD